jgi:hypothetical protein
MPEPTSPDNSQTVHVSEIVHIAEEQPLNISIVLLWKALAGTIIAFVCLLVLTIYAGPGGIGTGMLSLLLIPVIIVQIITLFCKSVVELSSARKKKQKPHIVHRITFAISTPLLFMPLLIGLYLLATQVRQEPAQTQSETRAELCERMVQEGKYVPRERLDDVPGKFRYRDANCPGADLVEILPVITQTKIITPIRIHALNVFQKIS